MRETKHAKALRYLAEHRLVVKEVSPTLIRASCRGDSGEVYELGYRADQDRWGCQCEASKKFHRECSHLLALKCVTVRPVKAPRSPLEATGRVGVKDPSSGGSRGVPVAHSYREGDNL